MRVLLATDFSSGAEIARNLAADITWPYGSHIRIAHALESTPRLVAFTSYALVEDGSRDGVQRELHRTVEALKRPSYTVDSVVCVGRPADVILREAAELEADVIVIGSRGRGALASAVLGSVSAEVIDRSPFPVLVARARTLSKIVLADDGTVAAGAGSRLVSEWPILRRLPIRVVSVVTAPRPFAIGDEPPMAYSAAYEAYLEMLPGMRAERERFARRVSEALVGRGLRATFEVREGTAGAQIVLAAEEAGADLIVIGTRGNTGLQRVASGSVARDVLFHAKASLLVANAKKVRRPDTVEAGAMEDIEVVTA